LATGLADDYAQKFLVTFMRDDAPALAL